jgi:hypothetical protein
MDEGSVLPFYFSSSWVKRGGAITFFDPENVDIFLRNFGLLPQTYMAFIPEDRNLLNQRYQNLKSYIKAKLFLCQNKRHVRKMHGGSGRINPCIFSFEIR